LSMPTTQTMEETFTTTSHSDASLNQEEQTKDSRVQCVQTKRCIVLEGCICGEVVSDTDKESNLAMTCKVLGCESQRDHMGEFLQI
jgi:hypothetical protein